MENDVLTLVTEEAFYHTVLPVNGEITGAAMAAFGGWNLQDALLYAFVGGFLAVFLLYLIGRIAAPTVSRWMGGRYTRFQDKLKWLLPVAALGVASPVGFVIAIALGLFKSPPLLALPVAAFALFFSYYNSWILA